MSGVTTLKEVLFHEMQVGVKYTQSLLGKIKPEHWDYAPCKSWLITS